MASNIPKTTISIYMLPGMTVKIKAIDLFVEQRNIVHIKSDGSSETVSLEHGFVVDNPDVGTITRVDGEPAVKYTHKKFANNHITFYAATGEIGRVFVNAIPIHDHASIVTGGPAYGTYFADDETTETT